MKLRLVTIRNMWPRYSCTENNFDTSISSAYNKSFKRLLSLLGSIPLWDQPLHEQLKVLLLSH